MQTGDEHPASLRVIEMYDHHPISAAQVLARLDAEGKNLHRLEPPDLFAHDQDHYGGHDANEAIARKAGLAAGMQVADFCAGLGGPARYLAHVHGVCVTGIELNARRVAGATELTRLVGLADKVSIRLGDVTSTGLEEGAFDAVISQEAFLHLPDKPAAIREAARVLKPAGRFVLSDWVVHAPLGQADAKLLWQGLAAQSLGSLAGYRKLMADAGLTVEEVDDLTAEWSVILKHRLRMYEALRSQARGTGLPTGEDAFHRAYVRLVALVEDGVLGGGRFTARKPERSQAR